MTSSDIVHHRLRNQQLEVPRFTAVPDLVGWLAAMQAQEYAQAKWAIGLRLPHVKDTDLEHLFTTGALIRTHLLRPTWHFVAAPDIYWMLLLTAPRVHAANAFMYRKLELETVVFNRCKAVFIKELEGGKQLTRTVLKQALQKEKMLADGMRLSYILMQAELDGIICSGARTGKQFTYALLEERVPKTKILNREEALAELSKRYFNSRGPATIKDFATWSGLTITEARQGLGMVSGELIREKIAEEDYYFPEPVSPSLPPLLSLHLLPIYDEYIMGYKNREAILAYRQSLQPLPPFRYDSSIVCDGQIIGTWKRTIYAKVIELEVDFFAPPSTDQSTAFEKAIDQFSRFTNLPVTVREK